MSMRPVAHTEPWLYLAFRENPDGTTNAQPLVFTQPEDIITAATVPEVLSALDRVKAACAAGYYAAGYIAYEASPAFDPALATHPPVAGLPLVWFGIFRNPTKSETASSAVSFAPPVTGWQPRISPGPRVTESALSSNPSFTPGPWLPNVSKADYQKAIRAIKEAISKGETYQVNYTFRMKSQMHTTPWTWFTRCVQGPTPPFAACLDLGRWGIVSLSPELFFRTDGLYVLTRPMKGTHKRGRYPREDEQHIAWLRTSEKNRAENVMIVDLLRNDLGHIAEPGTVRVESLFDVEVYPTALQMTSTISARLRQGCTWLDALAALFPCGSVTGAPKPRTAHIITKLETEPRGVYCGAIGYVTPQGQAIFSVAIRTLLLDRWTHTAVYGTGGGITWDSTPEGEFSEALVKTQAALQPAPAFELLETMRLQHGRWHLLEEHVERLLDSARYFQFTIDEQNLRRTLDRVAAEHSEGCWRVRLLAACDGRLTVHTMRLADAETAESAEAKPIRLAKSPIDSSNPFLFHKTTHRAVYDDHRAAAGDVFDVLLWNERKEATEFTIGNLVAQYNGQLYTPPCACGLLNGTLRRRLIQEGKLQERRIHVDELAAAERLWLINSVRGFVPVALVPASNP
ncbi:MAG: aminodeoxychorismate synthase component I [Alicyclobacillus shizuokensis]|nr:aminodeoxychorismate synthase component I [Alicyclobacillus shizuokensis]